jgi:ectoine hydroxylase-related dioxygenase (phytanoyl-CoA dioxygenase family)
MSLGKKKMEEEAAGGGSAVDSDATEKDDDERELEKLEKNDPEMLRICTVILDQLEKFKVRLCVIITKLKSFFNPFVCVYNLLLL